MSDCTDVDCEKGRSLGCQTYCCRLLVRLDPDEREAGDGSFTPKGYVGKTPDGYCIHLDREKQICKNWHNRPRACREYSCHGELLLQVALRHEFKNVVELVKLAASAIIPLETYITVPPIKSSE